MNLAILLASTSALLGLAMSLPVLWNKRSSWAHLAFGLGLILFAAEGIFNALSFNSVSLYPTVAAHWQQWRTTVSAFVPGVWLLFSLTYGRGNFREFLERWKIVIAIFLLGMPALGIFGNLFQGIPIQSKAGHWLLDLTSEGYYFNIFFLTGIVLVLMNLERTFRAAVGTMRWRIKFMIFGLGVLLVVRAYTSTQTLLFHAVDLSLQSLDCGAFFVGCLLMFRSLRREGHFEIDVYPSHSLLQNSLTALLAGIYLIVIGLFAKIVTRIGGDEAFTIKAFLVLAALVGLTVLLLSDRVRLQISRFISRHFQRPMFDYRTVWRKFTEATASCVSQAELCQASVKSVTDIFQALSVTIWLVDEKKERLVFAASTFLSEARAENLAPQKDQLAEIIHHLQQHHEPADIETTQDKWADHLRQCHPEEFRKGESIQLFENLQDSRCPALS